MKEERVTLKKCIARAPDCLRHCVQRQTKAWRELEVVRGGLKGLYIAFEVVVGLEVDFISDGAAETAAGDRGWGRHAFEI